MNVFRELPGYDSEKAATLYLHSFVQHCRTNTKLAQYTTYSMYTEASIPDSTTRRDRSQHTSVQFSPIVLFVTCCFRTIHTDESKTIDFAANTIV